MPRPRPKKSTPKRNALAEWILPLRKETAYSMGRLFASVMFILGLVGWLVCVISIVMAVFGGEDGDEVTVMSNTIIALSILPIAVSYFLTIALFDLADCAIERRGNGTSAP